MTTKRQHSPARRAIQIFIVFILSALIARTSFAEAKNSESRTQQYSCYSNM